MVPANSPLFFVYSLMYWLIGFVMGVAIGYLVTLIARNRPATFLRDGALGSFGFWGGFLLTGLVPWRYNTVTINLTGGGTVATTMNRYQHPERVALLLAIMLPLLNEVFRLRKRKGTRAA